MQKWKSCIVSTNIHAKASIFDKVERNLGYEGKYWLAQQSLSRPNFDSIAMVLHEQQNYNMD